MSANTGQTGRTFKASYRQHIQAISTNKQTSEYAQHTLDMGHKCNTIKETMEVLQIKKKGQFLNTLEHFHIYNLGKQKLQMNDTFADIHNPIVDLITKRTYHKTHIKKPTSHIIPLLHHPQHYTTTFPPLEHHMT
jgi:hypothetical protein